MELSTCGVGGDVQYLLNSKFLKRRGWILCLRVSNKKNICGSRILRTREPLGTQSPKPFPGTFLPENLENFLHFFFFLFQQIWTQHQKLEIWFPTPPPPPPKTVGILNFSKFGLGIKSWKLVPSTPLPPLPPPLDMGIWDFSKFGLS